MIERESPFAAAAWAVRGKALAERSGPENAAAWLQANHAPSASLRIIRKSPLDAVETSDLGLPVSSWADSMRASSGFYRILNEGGFFRAPLGKPIGITTQPSAAVVAEGASKPLATTTMTRVTLKTLKATSLMVVTDELLRDISAAGQACLGNALKSAVSDAIDSAFLGLIINTAPPAVPSSGTTASAAKKDLQTALLSLNTTANSRLYWIVGVDTAKRASTLAATGGADAFGAMSPGGGEMANLPALVSSGIPANSLLLVDASQIAADAGPVAVDTSSMADILMDSAPNMNSATPTAANMVSMWASNSVAIRAEAWFGAQPLTTTAVAEITNIAWANP